MKNFVEISVEESVCLAGGKDATVAVIVKVVGWLCGAVVSIFRKSRVTPRVAIA